MGSGHFLKRIERCEHVGGLLRSPHSSRAKGHGWAHCDSDAGLTLVLDRDWAEACDRAGGDCGNPIVDHMSGQLWWRDPNVVGGGNAIDHLSHRPIQSPAPVGKVVRGSRASEHG